MLADKLCPVDIAGGFKPARTQDGSATYGVIYQLIAQVGTDSPKWKEFVQMGQPYSLAVSDDEVGLAVKKPTEIELVVAVDQSGGISHCQPGKIAGKLEPAANMACAAVKRQVVKMPFAIPQGGFVMNYRVLIVHQKPKN